jgi:hypothetical protein
VKKSFDFWSFNCSLQELFQGWIPAQRFKMEAEKIGLPVFIATLKFAGAQERLDTPVATSEVGGFRWKNKRSEALRRRG